MQLYVGLSALRGKIKGFPFDMLELQVTENLPRPKTLRDFVAARPDLCFSLRLPVAFLDKSQGDAALDTIKSAADSLVAKVVVIPTGPRFTPTKRNQERLRTLATSLAAPDRTIAWEPHGVWSDQELLSWSTELNVKIVRDVMKEKPVGADFLYTRLRAFAGNSRLSEVAIERLVNTFSEFSNVFLVVDADGAQKTRKLLRDYLGLNDDPDSDDLDDFSDLLNQGQN